MAVADQVVDYFSEMDSVGVVIGRAEFIDGQTYSVGETTTVNGATALILLERGAASLVSP